MVDAFVVSTEINAHGKIVNISGTPLEDMLMPCDLLGGRSIRPGQCFGRS